MKLIVSAIISMLFAIPLLSQSDMEYALSRQKGNKIVLIGEWKAEDSAKWKQLVGSDEIYGHGFTILGCANFTSGIGAIKNAEAFERWFRQRCGLGGNARWAALDSGNKLIVSGIQMPSVKEFDQMLDARGVKTPLRRVRDFLKENPGHLDAMADLLKECRRRALHLAPDGADKDLDDGTDLRAWGVMASEMDKVFNGPWLGADINFFVLGQVQPERRSKLMRGVFRKHIPKIEQAILLEPTNETLWNIWAWMAQGIGDYKWEKFIGGIEPVVFVTNNANLAISLPSSEVATWLVWEAKERKDWGTVIKLARAASLPLRSSSEIAKTEWLPDRARILMGGTPPVQGHPIKTVYASHLEALLRLGDIDGANSVYDEMIRVEGKANVAAIADVARSLGMADLAALWDKGEQVNPVLSIALERDTWKGIPGILFSKGNENALFFKKIIDLQSELLINLALISIRAYNGSTLDWKADEVRWALVSADRRILFQDTSEPDADAFSAILKRFGIKSDVELYRQYIEDHGSAPGIELLLASTILLHLRDSAQNANSPDNARIEALAQEAAGYLSNVMRDNPSALMHSRSGAGPYKTIRTFMNSLPKPMLSIIESLLERKPSASILWSQWMYWNEAGELGRSLESLVERVKPSPLLDGGILGLPFSKDSYFKECKKNGSWPKVVALLKPAWDREYLRIIEPVDSRDAEARAYISKDTLGDAIGIHLIEAYLQDGRPGEADEIFRAVLECGGKFKEISKIIELAKAKGQDRLAAQWEAAAAKAGK